MAFGEKTLEFIEAAAKKKSEGKKLNMEDKVLLKLSDGRWHGAAELAYGVSWRFGGYLHNLKKKGVAWEKERDLSVRDAVVYRYRLTPYDESQGNAL